MSLDAEVRMRVYQEGQRAFNAETACPYHTNDWRSKTWEKGRAAAGAYHVRLVEPETVPCGLCGVPTQMKATRRCDWCWELEGRIRRNPDLARKILRTIGDA